MSGKILTDKKELESSIKHDKQSEELLTNAKQLFMKKCPLPELLSALNTYFQDVFKKRLYCMDNNHFDYIRY